MSATSRGSDRIPQDNYPTPAWCVLRLLDEWSPHGNFWLDPCAGEGSILSAIKNCDFLSPPSLRALELREECKDSLSKLGLYDWRITDSLTPSAWPVADIIITNPPYSQAQEFIERSLAHSPNVAMLLRLNYAGSAERAQFMRRTQPSVYVLPDRPSFAQSVSCRRDAAQGGKGWCGWRIMLPTDAAPPRTCPNCGFKTNNTKTDATEYAWFVWSPTNKGRFQVLAPTPKHERLKR